MCNFAKHPVKDELLSPSECARDFIDTSHGSAASEHDDAAVETPGALPVELSSLDGALEAAREWYAHALSVSVELRRLVRSHFIGEARLSTQVSAEGVVGIDPAHPLHRVVSEL